MAKPMPMDRIAFVVKMLASQRSHREISLALQEKYKCCSRQSYNYIKHAYRRMESEDKVAKPMRKVAMRNTLQYFYQEAMKAKQFAPALAALDRMCKIDGLYAPEEVSVSSTINHRVERMTSDDQRKELERLFKMYDTETGAGKALSEGNVGRDNETRTIN